MMNPFRKDPTTIAVVSGKGGVGKSLVAINLALTWANQGFRVAVMDADLSQGSCALLLGSCDSVDLVSPKDFPADPARTLARLDEQLVLLSGQYDFVVLDASAGVGTSVRWALDRADSGLLIVVDEPTAVADAYSLCKLVWSHDPAYPLAAAVNLADTEEEASSVLARFSALTQHFLNRKILYAGWVPFSVEIRQSVRHQRPAVLTSTFVQSAFEDLADRIRCGVFESTVDTILN
jgi:flagellar biosynthesis protein FlhG